MVFSRNQLAVIYSEISGSMSLALRVSRRARRKLDATGNLLLSGTVRVDVLDMLVQHVSLVY